MAVNVHTFVRGYGGETIHAVARGFRALGRALFAVVWFSVRWTATVALAGAVIAGAGVVAITYGGRIVDGGSSHTPRDPISFQPLAVRSVVYARDGSVLTVLHAEQDRVPVPLDRIPSHVVRAVLDAEDERFFEHGPLDVRAVLRAVVNNIEAGAINEGGSTITQQLVKTELLTPRKDVNRKLKEAVLAIQLENQMTKSQILERYLNTVYFGSGAYGLQAAAEAYFASSVEDITLPQAVLLAGVIRYPGGTDPFSYPDAARERRDAVADRMHELGHITPEQVAEVKAEPLPTPPPPKPATSSDYFAEAVKQELLASPALGESYQERYSTVFKGGLSIYTTLDPGYQQKAQEAVKSILPEDPRGFTAALVSVEPQTGAVRALVGGNNFDQTKFNLVTDGEGRQTGSSFKTFTLLAALEAGAQPNDIISGSAPCPISNPLGVPDPWSPSNVEGSAGGTLTVAQATISSVNCAYARLIKIVGAQRVVDVAHRMGITSPIGAHLSITLGSEPVTPLQMASAYATLANDGVRQRPYFIDKVVDPHGQPLIAHVNTQGERAVSSQNARLVNQTLVQTVQSGTGTAAILPGRQVAGKTGSTDSNADAWFVGYTPQLSTAVWMGAPEARVPMYGVGMFPRVYGGTYPAMIFKAFMGPALAGQPALSFPAPGPLPRGAVQHHVPADPPPNATAAQQRR